MGKIGPPLTVALLGGNGLLPEPVGKFGTLIEGEPAAVPAGAAEERVPKRLEPVAQVEFVDSNDKLTVGDVVDEVDPPGKAGRVVGSIGVPLGNPVVEGGGRAALLEDDVVVVEEMLD